MSLDFHHSKNRERLLSLNDQQQSYLEDLFMEFARKTGFEIDPYKTTRLSHENCLLLLELSDVALKKKQDIQSERNLALRTFSNFLRDHQAQQTDFIVHGD